jgi:hypothetical protein
MLWVLEALAKQIVVPPAVVEELAIGRSQGIQWPDPTSLEWVTVCAPAGAAVLPLVTDLGPGETEFQINGVVRDFQPYGIPTSYTPES